MPDPYASVGYLVAAGAITVIALGGYTVLLAQRLASARARNKQLRAELEG